jgi:hypothetical protein
MSGICSIGRITKQFDRKPRLKKERYADSNINTGRFQIGTRKGHDFLG